ncbi:MAG: protein kinase [Gammaproteobacteria bacterium]|nr:protein kinase [Gammaproteobacteria bacterium]
MASLKFKHGEITKPPSNVIACNAKNYPGYPVIEFPLMFGQNLEMIMVYHLSKIGSGSFGEVYLGYNLDRSELCVIKRHFMTAPIMKKITANEIDKLNKIGRLIDLVEEKEEYYSVQPLAKGYDLFDFLINGVMFQDDRKNSVVNSLEIPLSYGLEMAIKYFEALNSLHNVNKIVHRDLKLENIMWDPEKRKITILDFGLSADMQFNEFRPEGFYEDTQRLGTPAYVAPEILDMFFDETEYSPKTDLYASGIVLAFMVLNKAITTAMTTIGDFNSLGKRDLLISAFKTQTDAMTDEFGIKGSLVALVLDLLSENPTHRSSCEKVLGNLRNLKQIVELHERNTTRTSNKMSFLPAFNKGRVLSAPSLQRKFGNCPSSSNSSSRTVKKVV